MRMVARALTVPVPRATGEKGKNTHPAAAIDNKLLYPQRPSYILIKKKFILIDDIIFYEKHVEFRRYCIF